MLVTQHGTTIGNQLLFYCILFTLTMKLKDQENWHWRLSMTKKFVRVIETSKATAKAFNQREQVEFIDDATGIEMNLLMVYQDIQYQTINGFGGAFTESAAINYFKMNPDVGAQIREAYFGENGLRYNLGRTHIGSCDFSWEIIVIPLPMIRN